MVVKIRLNLLFEKIAKIDTFSNILNLSDFDCDL